MSHPAPSAGSRSPGSAVWAGTLASLCMIAYQMAGKATRDALFLSTYDADRLPAMVFGAAGLSLLLAFLASRYAAGLVPARVAPAAFAFSAFLTLVEWAFVTGAPQVIAIVMYLHFSGLSALLISAFWSVVSERFDPRTAKRHVARIAAGGTVGGLVGGILAERVAAIGPLQAMFPLLALLHLAAAGATLALGRGTLVSSSHEKDSSAITGLEVLRQSPYLATIAGLVLFTAVSEGLLDLVFKTVASDTLTDPGALLRFFAVFYTSAALITILIQAGATRKLMGRLGIAGTASSLPSVVALGSLAFLLVPGFWAVVLTRGSESATRNSLYRSSYELLFNPLPAQDKRVTKPILDVGVVRIGDMVAGLTAQIVIWLVPVASRSTPMMALTLGASIVALMVARRLHNGYLRTLERSLLARAATVQESLETQPASTVMLQTMAGVDLTQFQNLGTEGEPPTLARDAEQAEQPARIDADLSRVVDLRSRDPGRVKLALEQGPLSLELATHLVPLLAWDEVARDVIAALRHQVDDFPGMLTDSLVNPAVSFAIRRRIPLVLAESSSQRAVDGLVLGLADRRFEVRYRCGRALSHLTEHHGGVKIEREPILQAVENEVAVDRGVWHSHRLLDAMDDEAWSPVMDELVRDRADRSLEHVFTMLSLILPRQPLRVAFRGLHTDDPILRGTALEYLETALPERIRRKLWPFIEPGRAKRGHRSSEDIMEDLLKSQDSIAIRLTALKRLREEQD